MSNILAKIQSQIKAPKGQFNAFGKYKYRSCEDIVEAIKPVLAEHGFYLILTDDVVMIGTRFYFKAVATISDGTTTFSATGWAREEETKKGIDGSQVSGASSSYARKYALNGLFAIDDTKDSDATNTGDKTEQKQEVKVSTKPIFDVNHKHFQAAIDKINTGEGTLAGLESKFTISDETRSLIMSKLTV